ncbi:cytochrome P450 [Exidia glandulosa HHB12029]|uniref:Cytochrome P450 n=1 Tax=Exidia glandulosa HHB12029 TaxID=1314781 RepID=A0A165PN07_EXIGL|nr:cytochrome P450 [Exidia glandulosa HHB12029]
MYVSLAVLLVAAYALVTLCRPFVSLWLHYRTAKRIGLPLKVLPVPQGLFSFFAFQLARRLPKSLPGVTRLHAILNMGRPDGYGLHQELGDVFVTVNPAGISLIVADPNVASYINGRRAEFPKPPNTGAIINIYGRNVINADGDTWRLHRRVTGAAFSERIHSEVWDEAREQAQFMLDSWKPSSKPDSSFVVRDLGADTLRLGMNVITGAAYGSKLAWDPSSATKSRPFNPPCAVDTQLTYRESLEELTRHLMPLFLTPRWALRAAPAHTTWGRAWASYTAFGGYMQGMLDAQAGAGAEDNLLAALLRAAEDGPEGYRPMSKEEVMGNTFIFLFAGHETTANTLHYALLRLALHPDVQNELLQEVDEIWESCSAEEPSYAVFERATWAKAIMYETLRVHTPTGITNKYAPRDTPVPYQGRQVVIPAGTRIATNGTAVHFHPDVWGPDEYAWRPARWVVEGVPGMDSPETSRPGTPLPGTPAFNTRRRAGSEEEDYPTPPPTPGQIARMNIQQQQYAEKEPHSPAASPSSARHPAFILSHATSPKSPVTQGLLTPSNSHQSFLTASASTASMPGGNKRLIRPRRGAWLPFSEGSRACSGKKFAAVEFVRVMLTLLREHRVEILGEDEGWGEKRVLQVLAGRKAGALTLQPPEPVPVRFVRRSQVA